MSAVAPRGKRLRDPASTLTLFELASGGMGRVELVAIREGTFLRLYARKRLLAQYRQDEQFRSMFLDEARIAGLLRHANVVSVLDVDEDDDGPFLLMDYVEGVSLAKMIVKSREGKHGLSVQTCSLIASQIAKGLHAAHETTTADGKPLELIHRDISPQNVIVGYDGIVRVTDFGIARAEGRSSATTTGLLKGKPGYLSPEQLRFEKPDRRSDLFALGVVLWEMLAGERLYAAKDDVAAAYRTLNDPPPDFGEISDEIPPALVELGFELLAKNPSERPKTAREVSRRLDAIVAELAAFEGPVELAEYVETQFADERARQRARIAERLAALESSTNDDRPSLVLFPGEATPAQETRHLGPVAERPENVDPSTGVSAFAREMPATRRLASRTAIGVVGIVALLIGVAFAIRGSMTTEGRTSASVATPEQPAPAVGASVPAPLPVAEATGTSEPIVEAGAPAPSSLSAKAPARTRREAPAPSAVTTPAKPSSPFENLGTRE